MLLSYMLKILEYRHYSIQEHVNKIIIQRKLMNVRNHLMELLIVTH